MSLYWGLNAALYWSDDLWTWRGIHNIAWSLGGFESRLAVGQPA